MASCSPFLGHMRWAIELFAQVAQSVEHVLGKDEVSGSIPLLGLSSRFSIEIRVN